MIGPDGRKRRLGSYHQCYRLDGKLVAIGVLDLLPDCVSSVYFLYDESIHRFTPGKLGALYEIALAIEDGYRWWYPGFYIHSCPKMRYKIDYMPQYILDPQSLAWDELTKDVLDLLDKKPFVSMHLERSHPSEGEGTEKGQAGDTVLQGDVEMSSDEGAVEEENDSDETDHFLFHSTMPGIATLEEVEKVELDHIVLKASRLGPLHETSDLVSWDTTTISQWPGIKAGVAELVAALGTDCVDVLCLDFVRG